MRSCTRDYPQTLETMHIDHAPFLLNSVQLNVLLSCHFGYISILIQRSQWNTEATGDKKTKRVCSRDRAFTSRYDKFMRRDVTIVTFHRQFRCVSDEPFLGSVFRRLFPVVRNELANRKNPIEAGWLFYFPAKCITGRWTERHRETRWSCSSFFFLTFFSFLLVNTAERDFVKLHRRYHAIFMIEGKLLEVSETVEGLRLFK